MASSSDTTSKESGATPFFHYMRQSHPAWTCCSPSWNGRYVHFLNSLPILVQQNKNRVDAFFVEGKGYDRRLLSHLIPCVCPEVHKIGFNGTRLLLHLRNISLDSQKPSSSSSSSVGSETFASRFASFVIGKPIIHSPPQTPQDVLEISEELDTQIQGLHLWQFHHLCRKVLQAFLKKRKTTSMFIVGPLVDRHLAKIMVRSMDPNISPVIPFKSPDGRITLKRNNEAKSVDSLSLDFPYMPPAFSRDENRETNLDVFTRRFLNEVFLTPHIKFVCESLSLTPPTLEQIYSIARDYLVSAPEEKNTTVHLLQSSVLIFPFRVYLKDLYHELVIIDERTKEKNMHLRSLIQVFKRFLSQKNVAMQSLPDFIEMKSVADTEVKKLLIDICGGKQFLSKLKKLKKLPLIEKEAAQIRKIHSLTFEFFCKEEKDVTGDITPKKVARSLFPDSHPNWAITINSLPFHPSTDEQSVYFYHLIGEISRGFKDGKMRVIQDETTRFLEGVKVNEKIDTAFRNGRVIRKMDSDAFPILQRMTIEAWGPADPLLREKCPRLLEKFHFRRKKPQTQLCDVEVKSTHDHQVTHKYAYVLFEKLSAFATGMPYTTMTLEWSMTTPHFQGVLKISEFSFTPELENAKHASLIKQEIFEAFLSDPS